MPEAMPGTSLAWPGPQASTEPPPGSQQLTVSAPPRADSSCRPSCLLISSSSRGTMPAPRAAATWEETWEGSSPPMSPPSRPADRPRRRPPVCSCWPSSDHRPEPWLRLSAVLCAETRVLHRRAVGDVWAESSQRFSREGERGGVVNEWTEVIYTSTSTFCIWRVAAGSVGAQWHCSATHRLCLGHAQRPSAASAALRAPPPTKPMLSRAKPCRTNA